MRKTALVVGAGIAGLTTALELKRLGYTVSIVERGADTYSGSSSGNEGWLHRGTYHSINIADPEEAAGVVRDCIDGHHWVTTHAPEALVPHPRPMIALALSTGMAERCQDRWTALGVSFTALSRKELARSGS